MTFNKHTLLIERLHDEAALDRAEEASDGEELSMSETQQLGSDYLELESMARAYVDQIGELHAMVSRLRDEKATERARTDFAFQSAQLVIADLERQLSRLVTYEYEEPDEDGSIEPTEHEDLLGAVVQ